MFFFFFKQKTAYEVRISDWSSDVCSSDLSAVREIRIQVEHRRGTRLVRQLQIEMAVATGADPGPRECRTADAPAIGSATPLDLPVDGKIGRASRRERGGQSV